MEDLSFPLVEWLTDLEDVKYNLASSSVKPIDLSDLGELQDVCLGYPEDEIEEELEYKIAGTYDSEVNTVLAPGAQAANSLIFDAFLAKKDEVLVEDPTYLPLQTGPTLKGASIETFKRRYDKDFKVDLDEIKKKCSDDTKMIVLTNPHNPSGVFQESKSLKDLFRFVEKNNIYLLVDEIYRDFVADSYSTVSMSNNVIVTSSLSKVYGLGGLRLGWAASKDKSLIDDLKGVKKHQTPKMPTPTVEIGLMAFEERERLLKHARDIAEKGRSLAHGWVSGTSEIEWVKPSPGIISFPRLKIDMDGEKFAKKAKEEAGILVAPGSYFSQGEEFDSHLRLTFGKDFQATLQGFQRLAKTLQEIG